MTADDVLVPTDFSDTARIARRVRTTRIVLRLTQRLADDPADELNALMDAVATVAVAAGLEGATIALLRRAADEMEAGPLIAASDVLGRPRQ